MTETKNEIEELDNEIDTFDEMEKTFHNVVSELVSDHSLDKFREDYEVMHKALVDSHNDNKELIEKCRQLNNDILSNASKISAVLDLSKNDQRTIAGLRSEFEKAWSMVEISQDREAKSKDVIEMLKSEVSNLSKLVEQGGSLAFSQELSLQEISDEIVMLKKEIQMQAAQLEGMKQHIAKAGEDQTNAKEETLKLKEEFEQMTQESLDVKNEEKNVSDESDRIHQDIGDMKNLIVKTKQDIEGNSLKIKKMGISNSELNSDYWSEVSNTKISTEDKEISIQHVHLKEREFENTQKQGKKILTQISNVNENIEEKEEVLGNFKGELDKIVEENEELRSALDQTKKIKNEIEEDRAQTRLDFVSKQHQMYLLLSDVNKISNTSNIMKSQTDKMVADTRQIKSQLEKETQEMKTVEETQKNIIGEVLSMKAHSQQDQKKIATIEKETATAQEKSLTFRGNIYHIRELVRVREESLAEKSTDLNRLNDQIRRQVALMEQTQTERDLACKQNEEMNHQNDKIVEDLDALENEISGLKNAIQEGVQKCIETHYNRKCLEEHLATLEVDVNNLKEQIKFANDETTQLRNKIQRSAYLLSKAEIDKSSQSHIAAELVYTNRAYDRSATKRINEAEALRQKAKLLQSYINHSATSYRKKQEELKNLNDVMLKEVHKHESLLNSNRHGHALWLESIRVEKALLLEQGKAKALEEDLEKPLNVHRWRILNGTNPEVAQLIRMQNDLRDKLMFKMTVIDRLKNNASKLKSRANVMEGHLEKSAANGERYSDEFRFLTEILHQRNAQLKEMKDQMFQQRDVAIDQKDQVMTVRTLVREEKANYYTAKKKVVKIRAKTAAGSRAKSNISDKKPREITSSRRGKQTRFVGGGFAVTNATLEHPTTRPIGFPLNSPHPGSQLQQIPSALSTSPRKQHRDAHTAMTRLPSGWNPRRPPTSPYLPTLTDRSGR